MEQVQAPSIPFSFELYVQQVVNGCEYKGYLKRNGKELRYTIRFTIPIPELNNASESELASPEAVRRVFPIQLFKADGTEVPIPDDLYGFFFETVALFAVDFYYHPQTRNSNGNPRMQDLVRMIGASMNVSMGATRTFAVTPELNQRLEEYFT